MKIESYPFSTTATPQPPDILQGKSPQEFLNNKYQRGCFFGLDSLKTSGYYKLAGWCFNFKPHLKLFLVKQYGHWQEEWAPNKTAIRKSLYGRIQKIVSIV